MAGDAFGRDRTNQMAPLIRVIGMIATSMGVGVVLGCNCSWPRSIPRVASSVASPDGQWVMETREDTSEGFLTPDVVVLTLKRQSGAPETVLELAGGSAALRSGSASSYGASRRQSLTV